MPYFPPDFCSFIIGLFLLLKWLPKVLFPLEICAFRILIYLRWEIRTPLMLYSRFFKRIKSPEKCNKPEKYCIVKFVEKYHGIQYFSDFTRFRPWIFISMRQGLPRLQTTAFAHCIHLYVCIYFAFFFHFILEVLFCIPLRRGGKPYELCLYEWCVSNMPFYSMPSRRN